MDRRERMDDPLVAMRAALDGRQSAIFTMMPGIIDTYDPATMTAKIQPAIQGNIPQFDGTVKPTNLPVVIFAPVVFPGGGAYSFTFPLVQGDEVLIFWAMRSVDAWWQQGGVQPQVEARMHDISDGFCIPKVWSQKKKLANVSADHAQLRSDDGTVLLEIGADGFHVKGPVVFDDLVTFKGDAAFEGKANYLVHTHTTSTNPSGPPD